MGSYRDVERIRSAIEQLEDAVREAEAIRDEIDRVRRRQPYWPERRAARHWSSDAAHPDTEDPPPGKKR